jgi:hypothetical protein
MFAFAVSLLASVPSTEKICLSAIYLCVSLYAGSKCLIYLFFIERLHLIARKGPRIKDPVYLVSVVMLTPFFGVTVLMMMFREAQLDHMGCHIGLSAEAALPLVVYDTFFGLYQCLMFAGTIFRHIRAGSDAQNILLRQALKIALLGSAAAFMLSFLNVLTFAVFELLNSDLCLFFCVCDVVGNACVITYLMRPVSATTKLCGVKPAETTCKNVGVNIAEEKGANSPEEEFEQELQMVADMLKNMKGQRHYDPTTSVATAMTGLLSQTRPIVELASPGAPCVDPDSGSVVEV